MPTISADSSSVLNSIGNTPLFHIKSSNDIFAKLERENPFGSIKDRIAISMIEDAEEKGILKKGDTLIESSSGNTGIALASIALIKGYKMKVVLAESASQERVKLIKSLGAEIIFVKQDYGRAKTLELVKKLAEENNWVLLNQYENQANVRAHWKTAGEIIKQLPVVPNYFVAGIGTGGTITGVSQILKKKYPNIKVIGIIPEDRIEGLKSFEDSKPGILDLSLIDEIVKVKEIEAKIGTQELVKKGLLVGVSSGAAYYVSKKLKGNIITIFPDGIDKYLSYI